MRLVVLLLCCVAALAQEITVLAIPLPMETVRERLDTRATPVGLWNVFITGKAGTTVPRESLMIAVAEWCRVNKAPMPLLLTKEQAWPIIAKRAGGKWKLIQRIIGYAGVAAAIAAWPPAAAASPLLELVSARAGERIPDTSALLYEIPAAITIPASGGVTLSVWSSRMRNAHVIGPITIQRSPPQ
jgi:hypothetical protein